MSRPSNTTSHSALARARSIGLVAGFDLLESLRSRKAVVLLALYALGSLGGSAIFVRLLVAVRERLEDSLGHPVSMQELLQSPGLARVVGALAGDPEVASTIATIAPMALFYGWLAMNFVPLLVLFTSADAISGDLASGAARFALFRTDRFSWATGKLFGQAAMMAVGVLVGAVACWVLGLVMLEGMPPADTAYWLLRISGRSIAYGFSYLGMVLCASQLTRTAARSGGLALLMMFCASIGGGILRAEPVLKKSPALFDALSKLVPNGHYLMLWHPGTVESLGALFAVVAIGLGFFALGFWRFSKRDA